MNRYEKDEISKLPSQYRPLGAWGYFWYTILFAIPVIGWIAWIVCACSSSNINRRSYARSFLCAVILIVVAALALVLLGGGLTEILAPLLEQLEQILGGAA